MTATEKIISLRGLFEVQPKVDSITCVHCLEMSKQRLVDLNRRDSEVPFVQIP